MSSELILENKFLFFVVVACTKNKLQFLEFG